MRDLETLNRVEIIYDRKSAVSPTLFIESLVQFG